MAVIKISKDNFVKEVVESKSTVLVDFYADWCGPCKMVAPMVEAISEERSDIKVCKVNVDDEPELAQQFGVMNIPLLAVMKEGKVVNGAVGARSKDEILAML